MKKTIREQLDTAARKYARDNAAGSETVEEAYIYGAKWWQRNAAKTLKDYERDLTKAHEEVIGPVTFAIKIMIRRVARLWEKVDRLHDELDMLDSFMGWAEGSMRQMKQEIDPRLASLEKYERTLEAAFTSIGLTYNATPSKIREDKRRGADSEKDGLMSRIDEVKDTMNDVPDEM